MDYWRGEMNWPIRADWKCETCGTNSGLTWGLVHGVCRCNTCHTEYCMRVDGEILEVPACDLKPEYAAPAKLGWEKYRVPISEFTDEMWDEVMK